MIQKKFPARGPASGPWPTAPLGQRPVKAARSAGRPNGQRPRLMGVPARAHARGHRGRSLHGGKLTGGPLVAGRRLSQHGEHQRGGIWPSDEEATAGTHRGSSAARGR
jgi:hypothetical protein